MALISREEFKYNDYNWTAYDNNDPKIAGEPDKTQYNRKEGHEALYMINKFAQQFELTQKSSGQKAEEMLHDYLPGDVESQEKVMRWLKNNWNDYKY